MCHWESSSRSLYVKTVWANGHHHAILTPEDPLSKAQSYPSLADERKNVSIVTTRYRSAKSNPVPHQPRKEFSDADLSVSSVQIFFDGLQRQRPRSKRQSAVSMYQIRERDSVLSKAPTIAVVPMDTIKMRNLNVDVDFGKNASKRKSRRSNSYDVGMNVSRKEEKSWMEPYVSGITSTVGQNTPGAVLSERVMLWLDLARQSQESRFKEIEDDRLKEERERKQSKKSLTSPHWIPYLDYGDENAPKSTAKLRRSEGADTVGRNHRDDLHFNDISILKSSPMKLTQSAAISETVSEAQDANSEGRKNESVSCVSSKLENAEDVSTESERLHRNVSKKSYAATTSKRQLHIFMPNVPKKKVDSEGRSILSDISSRYSTKVKFTV